VSPVDHPSGPGSAAPVGRRLAGNAALNLFGQLLVAVCALLAIPFLIAGLGELRFAALALCWALINYGAIFDLGVGRALTQAVASRAKFAPTSEIRVLVAAGLRLALGVGLVGAATVAVMSPWLAEQVLNIPQELESETVRAFYLVSVSIPLTSAMSALRGVLEGRQRFGLVNAARVPALGGTFLAPLAVLPFSGDLSHAVAAVLLVRAVAVAAFWAFCMNELRGPLLQAGATGAVYRDLLRFGGWMSVTNLVGPLMDYMDRFLIGALLPLGALAYYTTSYELVTKLLVFSAAIVAVAFPAFAAAMAVEAPQMKRLFDRVLLALALLMFPVVFSLGLFGHQVLTLWVGQEIAGRATAALQILAVGVLANALAQLPFALVQGLGRADLTAKLHLLELPFYLSTAWWLIGTHGIEGAATAWTLRVAADALLLFIIARRLAPELEYSARAIGGILLLVGLAGLPLCLEPLAGATLVAGILMVVVITALLYAFAWFRLLSSADRAATVGLLSRNR
jgi:O-antigen/teichoic acid export membrane protein